MITTNHQTNQLSSLKGNNFFHVFLIEKVLRISESEI